MNLALAKDITDNNTSRNKAVLRALLGMGMRVRRIIRIYFILFTVLSWGSAHKVSRFLF